jgi:hypothetical protein
MRLTKIATVFLILCTNTFAAFDPCKFNFGMAWNGNGLDYSEVDYITVWAGSDEDFNVNWTGAMLQKCKSLNKTPVIYSYIIAFTASRDLGLKDCASGTPNLCQQGANFIRDKKSRILGQYDKYINGVKNSFGTTDPVIWLMEPDYNQYCEGNQEGGVLSTETAGQLMHELVVKIKATLPNSVISMDLSPNTNQSAWFGNFQMNDFMYIHTSGGKSKAASGLVRAANPTTLKSVHDLAKKCIIADDGYSTGGASGDHDPAWDDINILKNRISDGVIALTQGNPTSDWAGTIKSLRSQVPKPICPCQSLVKPRFALTINATGTGTVLISPTGASFDSGTTVTVSANPESGETFNGWSGDLSGMSATETIVMNSDKKITAAFSSNKPMSYKLTVQTSGSGTVEVSPAGGTYPSGTSVALTAKPAAAASFINWGGALSGSANPATLVIDGNKTVIANFYGGVVAGNLVKNGDFSTNADSWGLGVYDNAKASGGQSGGKYSVTTQSAGANEWNIQLSQSGIKLDQGKSYRLSFKASGKSGATIQVNIGMSGEPYTSYSQLQTVSLAGSDSVYVINFTMNEASTTGARLEFNGGKTSGTWNIDDVVLIDPSQVSVFDWKRRTVPNTIATTPAIGPDAAVKADLYDHTGRLIRQYGGKYQDVLRTASSGKAGAYLMVVRTGSNMLVAKVISVE